MALYCGIDLHSNNSLVAVTDEQDKPVYERRLPNELPTIISALEPYRPELIACVVESTYNWYWLVDGLMDAGLPTRLAHTVAMPQYDGLKHGDDRSDARHLAHLLRLGLLPEGHIMPRELRAVRDLLRRRLLLVRQRTLHHLSLQSLIARHTGKRLNANEVKRLDGPALDALLAEPTRFGGQITRLAMNWLNDAIGLLEQEVAKHLKARPEYRLLTSIPGVGVVLGSTIVLETGDIGRFAAPGNYASYARCVKSERLSNGKRKGSGNRKNGNRYLAWAFMEAAHYAAIWSPPIKRYYAQRKATRHLLVAKKAVANKLARAVYHMLKNREPFVVERAFG